MTEIHNWYPLLEKALNRGHKIHAIKLWRNVSNMSLKEAKDYMDEVFTSQRLPNGYDARYPDLCPDDYYRHEIGINQNGATPNWYQLLEFGIKNSLKLPAIKLWRTISGADIMHAKNIVEILLENRNFSAVLSYGYPNITDAQINDNRNYMLRVLDYQNTSSTHLPTPNYPDNTRKYIRELENLLVLTECVKNVFLSHNDGLLVLLAERVENVSLPHNDGVVDAIDALKKQIDFYINTK
jgi:ribosomal protein L7/L12